MSRSKKQRRLNVDTVLSVLNDEVHGNVRAALDKLSEDYTMTWVYEDKYGNLFPSVGPGIKEFELSEAYKIKGRRYDVRNIVENKDVVMVEVIESYPNPQTRKVHRTPLVLVLEMRRGKIVRGRHYCDPRISHHHLSRAQVESVFH